MTVKEQAIEIIQNVASGKSAMVTAAAIGTTPAWIKFVNGETMQAFTVVIAIILSLTIIAVNVQTFVSRRRKEKARQDPGDV